MTDAGDGRLITTDDVPVAPQWCPPSRWARWRARWRRQHGPLVRYWSAEFVFLGADPVTVEEWPAWARRQARRLIP